MSFTEDLTPFFQTGDFADEITYTPADGSAVLIDAIFDHAYVEVLGVEAERPVLYCKTADITGCAHGDALTISGASYLVTEVQPNGTGVSMLVLEAQ